MSAHWIDLGGGKRYDFLQPFDTDFDIAEIATSLSRTSRFNGRGAKRISTAEHSVNVSRLVSPRYAFDGLMHDAHESVVGDVTSPLKELLPDFKPIDLLAPAGISRAFGNALRLPREVEIADLVCLKIEAEALGMDTSVWRLPDLPKVNLRLQFLAPAQAKRVFLQRYRELTASKLEAAR